MTLLLLLIAFVLIVRFSYISGQSDHNDDFNEEEGDLINYRSDHYNMGQMYNYQSGKFDNGHSPGGIYDL